MAVLITETFEDVKYLYEGNEDDKKLYIKGIFLQGDIKNRNGRIYPNSVLEKEVNRFNKEIVEKNRAYGELGHPTGPGINLDKVSHIITEIWKDNGTTNYFGKAKIVEKTPMGSIVKNLIEAGANLGVSTRGIGSLREKNGIMEVQNDFRMATVDIVSDPSGPDCFVNGIMEGYEFIRDEKGWKAIEVAKKQVEESVVKRELNEETKLKIFKRFINSLK